MPVLVHLVRHGEVHNPTSLSYGRLPGFPLSDRGRAQAATSAEYLRAFGGRIQLLATSPLERAWETAEIVRLVTGAPEPVLDERLIEASSWRDGLPRALSPFAYARRYFNRTERLKSESPADVAQRMRDVVLDVYSRLRAYDEDNVAAVLVSHQTPIWWARVAFERGLDAFQRAVAQNVTPWIYVRNPCDLASVTTFVFESSLLSRPNVRYFSP